MHGKPRTVGFTLIELLVVIAVIALLVGMLLPALGKAREAARMTKCSSNARSVAQGVYIYNATNKELFPPHYVYANSQTGSDWDIADQQEHNPVPANGYIHWSASLFDNNNPSAIGTEAFTCPSISTRGGAPRTNPGANANDWEAGQVSDTGGTTPADYPTDRQAARIAFTGNAAIFPRNKFQSGSVRSNRLVKDSEIELPAQTIMATEFFFNGSWSALTAAGSGGNTIKSHRPVTPFVGISSGANVYDEPPGGSIARFRYPDLSDIVPEKDVAEGAIEGANGTTLNAVGRTHKARADKNGGGANFAYTDGHVEYATIAETIKARRWGSRFYSLTGNGNGVATH